MDDLAALVRAWRTRAIWQRGLSRLFLGLACGLGAALALAIAARFVPFISVPRLAGLSVLAGGIGTLAALGLPWARLGQRTPLSWAQEFDRRLGLKERLSTALEAREGGLNIRNDALRNLQWADTLDRANAINPRRKIPLAVSRRDGLISGVLMLLLLAAIFLPNPQQAALAQREKFQEATKAEAQRIAEVEKAIEESTVLSADQKKSALDALDQARRKLENPNVTPEQALAALNDARSRLDALQAESNPAARQDLREAGQAMTPDELTQRLAQSLAQGDFQKAAEQMRQLSNKNGQALTEGERQRVANQLDEMARQVQASDTQLANQLREAAQDLREGKAEAAQQQLDKASDSLDKASQAEASEEQLESAEASAAEARQRVAEASGQPSTARPPQSPPTGNSSESGQPSPDPSQSGQQGQGQGQSQGNPQNGGQNAQQGADSAGVGGQVGPSEDSGSASNVYAPGARLNPAGSNVVLPEAQGKSVPDPNSIPKPALPGSSLVPYQQVFREYARTADQALQTGEVPPALRDYIRDYFSALDPKK